MSIEDITTELEDRLAYNGDLNYIKLIESSGVIGRIASLILGILSMVILILVPVIVAMEVIYICFPAIREKTNEMLEKLETKGADKRLLGIAFRDAKHAISSVYCGGSLEGSTSDILWCYFKIKCKSVIFIFFILAFVLQGGAIIVNTVWNFVGNLIESIFY